MASYVMSTPPRVSEIVIEALSLGVITVEQESQINQALWLGRYDAEELSLVDRLIDALHEGEVRCLETCLAA